MSARLAQAAISWHKSCVLSHLWLPSPAGLSLGCGSGDSLCQSSAPACLERTKLKQAESPEASHSWRHAGWGSPVLWWCCLNKPTKQGGRQVL